ncbi:5-(carboxyamino)imidazole ribonucleotide mutase, partial [Candidatus Woesebacteria bacterium]|nr:5-(carboxyamino)imidazole ribonucleotide mutase [Candidatus Woesebacteria bacterium]
MATAQGDIRKVKIKNDNKARVVVAGASRGYPGDYSDATGKQIFGIEEVLKMDGVRFYSAGVKKRGRNYYTNGGRLFYMVGEGKDVVEARQKAYEAMSTIFVEGNNLHYRTDIGWRDV